MEESNTRLNEAASGSYDAPDRLFDFLSDQGETALVCETDARVKEKIVQGLKSQGYVVNEVKSVAEALQKMRFHVFDVLLIHEGFDAENGTHELLRVLNSLDMSIRRRIFVALIGDAFRTMDGMEAFHRSVNLVVNTGDLDELGVIIKRGVQGHKVFYHMYTEALKKIGRI